LVQAQAYFTNAPRHPVETKQIHHVSKYIATSDLALSSARAEIKKTLKSQELGTESDAQLGNGSKEK
jgi:hypothetical protein